MTSAKGKGVPDSVLQMLAAADERNGLPKGTMASVMQQEVGGNFDKYLADPGAYHYEAGPDGRRVAAHTGKVSTAFGPFGILESTGADPGYGVKPLQGKGIEEQIRFASDYLSARSKSAGGLAGGLAGYGEGTKYAQQVASRLPGQGGAAAAPTARAPAGPGAVVQAVATPQIEASPIPPEMVAQVQEPVATPVVAAQQQGVADPWQEFMHQMQAQGQQRPVQVADLSSYGAASQVRAPSYQVAPVNTRPDFRAFGAWGGLT